MQIDGQCHCGRITYEAEIDPDIVSVCHCRDCQTLTGSPFRVTALCVADDVRLTAGTPKVYGKRGDNGRMRSAAFLRRLRFPAVRERRGRPGRRLGHPLGQHPPARRVEARQADLVSIGRGLDRRGAGAAGAGLGIDVLHLPSRSPEAKEAARAISSAG